MILHSILDIIYVISPIFAFLPQIFRKKILYSPLLSLLSIVSSIIKIMHYKIHSYNIILLYQFIVILLVHIYLIKNYRNPLRNFELMFFPSSLCLKYGLFSCALTFVFGLGFMFNFFYIFNYGHFFGDLACILDVFITFLQLLIYTDAKSKITESFIVWIVGDAIKIILLVFFYKSPMEYCIATVLQILMNTFTLFKNIK